MTTAETMKARLAEFRSRLYGRNDLAAVDDYLHPDYRSHNGFVGLGRDGYKAFARGFHEGMPDLRHDMHKVLVEGDCIVAFTRWEATHTGRFRGIAPTGKKITFETADLYRLQDGLLVEHWDVVDRLAISVDLGLFRKTAHER